AHRPAGIPDFGHVTDFVAIKLHDVDVIGAGALPCWRAGTALTGMRCREYAVSAHAAALMICRKRFYDIPPIWHEGQQTLHPFGVGLQRADVGQRFRLRREARIRKAMGAASLPTFARLASLKELLGDGCDVRHVSSLSTTFSDWWL